MPVISCIQLLLFHFLLKVVYLPWLCLCVFMYLAVFNFSDSIWNLKLFLMCIFPLCPRLVRRGSLVSVMTRLRAGLPKNCGHIPGSRKTFISTPKRPAGSRAHPAPYTLVTETSLAVGKATGVCCWPPTPLFKAEVENEWNCISTVSYPLMSYTVTTSLLLSSLVIPIICLRTLISVAFTLLTQE